MSDLLVELGLGNQQTFKSASEEPSNFTVQNWRNESNRYVCVGTLITGFKLE